MRWAAIPLILLACGAGACSRSTMANYYVLTPPASESAGAAPTGTSPSKRSV